MPQSAEASAESPCHVHLPHRQEAFARHVAAGRSLTEAARLAGYAWDSARQTGSRLMKEPHIAARAAHLSLAREDQRQGELDELVSVLKRVMIDSMGRQNDFAALRAIDMIARLRGLVPTAAKRSSGLDTAMEEMRLQEPRPGEAEEEAGQGAEQGEGVTAQAPALDAESDTVFDPPMPPEAPSPVDASPAPEPTHPRSTDRSVQRAAALEANRAAVRRRIFCCEHLLTLHPELSGRIDDPSDALAYFDENDRLLPKELWPSASIPPTVHAGGEGPAPQ